MQACVARLQATVGSPALLLRARDKCELQVCLLLRSQVCQLLRAPLRLLLRLGLLEGLKDAAVLVVDVPATAVVQCLALVGSVLYVGEA